VSCNNVIQYNKKGIVPGSYVDFPNSLNPLPHRVLASFYLNAGGLLRPPEEGDISREKTIVMT
jgi:hypothetical protein